MKRTLQLSGLHCGHCVKSVEKALSELPTVINVQVDLPSQQAVIESEEFPEVLIKTIENIGFDATLIE